MIKLKFHLSFKSDKQHAFTSFGEQGTICYLVVNRAKKKMTYHQQLCAKRVAPWLCLVMLELRSGHIGSVHWDVNGW